MNKNIHAKDIFIQDMLQDAAQEAVKPVPDMQRQESAYYPGAYYSPGPAEASSCLTGRGWGAGWGAQTMRQSCNVDFHVRSGNLG